MASLRTKTGSEINVIVLDEDADPAAEADASDLLLVNRGGVDYCATVAEVFPPVCELEELPDFRMSWEGHDGGIWHIKNVRNGALNIEGSYTAWNIDGTNQRTISSVAEGEELVFITEKDANELFANNPTQTWEFGKFTDTSQVTYMASMFYNAKAFNYDIGDWDTGNVENMNWMFCGAEDFNGDISRWDTSSVEDTRMEGMFKNAAHFNRNLAFWCVKNFYALPDQFDVGSEFEGQTNKQPQWGTCPRGEDVMPWDDADVIYHVIITNPADINVIGHDKIYNKDTEAEVSSINAAGEWIITGANTIFKNSTGNWDFGDLTDTSQVTNMKDLFYRAEAFNSDISNWDVGNVMFMTNMFSGAQAFNQDISEWDVSNVMDIDHMFRDAHAFNSDISNWNVSNVNTMLVTFSGARAFNSDISKWDVSKVRFMHSMFYGAESFNQDIGNWEVGNVWDMQSMFEGAAVFNQDLSGWCVSIIPSIPSNFDKGSGFSGQTAKQPQWGTCPRGD